MTRCALLATSALLALLVPHHALAEERHSSDRHDYRVVTYVEGLSQPWSMTFLPDGSLLVTEKSGALRMVRDGELLESPIEGTPKVHAVGQGGLLDVVLHPDYADNGWIYLSHALPQEEEASTTTVVRGRLDGMRWTDQETIFVADSSGRGHYGSRLAFDDAGYLFITVGDRQASTREELETHPAQDLSNHHGVVVRLHDDGRIPKGNPFLETEDAHPEIWSYGHRNPQGMAVHPDTGDLWITEHGPEGGDELNRVEAGNNYGWPVVGYGVHYGGESFHKRTHGEGMINPTYFWVPSIAVSGLAIYKGEAFPAWDGLILAGGLRGQRLELLEVDGDDVVFEDILLRDQGRIRDVRVGPDGFVYVAIDNKEETTAILRLEPLERGPYEQ